MSTQTAIARPVNLAAISHPSFARSSFRAPAVQASPAPAPVALAKRPSEVDLHRSVDGRELAGVEQDRDAGLATAEWAVLLIAVAAFAGLMMKVLTGGGVVGLLTKAVTTALSTLF
jgi:hypothetical protein